MLSISERIEFLKNQELLASLSPETVEGIVKRMGEREFADHEIIFREGDAGDTLYFIVKGGVEIFKGEENASTVLAVLEAPDLFGDMAVLGEGIRTTSARARGPVNLLFLKDKAIKILIQNTPETAFGLFRILTHRLARMNEYVTALATKHAVRATLTVIEGPDRGHSVSMVGNRLEIGRRGGSPLEESFRCSLNDPSAGLARRHAEIVFQHGAFFLKDLGSKEGTSLNDEKIENPVDLQSGDTITVGATRLKFEIPPAHKPA